MVFVRDKPSLKGRTLISVKQGMQVRGISSEGWVRLDADSKRLIGALASPVIMVGYPASEH